MAAVLAAFLFGGYMETVKVIPWGKDQGDYVVINKEDFDEKKHKIYEENKEEPKKAAK